jgi:hypothetical protein
MELAVSLVLFLAMAAVWLAMPAERAQELDAKP